MRSRIVGPLALTLLVALSGPAAAAIERLNATCPGGREIHVDEGGYAYVDGQEAEIAITSDSYYEVSLGDFSAGVLTNPDGSVQVTYTGPGGANGICQVTE